MIRYECDKCEKRLEANDPRRYIVKIEVFAAAGPVDVPSEQPDDPQAELAEIIDQLSVADPDEIEDQTYRSFRMDVCEVCSRAIIQKPLG